MTFKFRLLSTVLFFNSTAFKLMKVTLKITSLFHMLCECVGERKKLDLAYNDAGKFPVMIRKNRIAVTVDKLRRSSGTKGSLAIISK